MGYWSMKLNFYLECATALIGIVLWCACSRRYNILDLKDQIYLKMIRCTTVMAILNLLACIIIRRNWFPFRIISGIIICISFIYMVGILMHLNMYLKESICSKNSVTSNQFVWFGFPLFLMGLALLVNCGTQYIYGVTQADGNIQIVFNALYKIPYILAICSLAIYSAQLLKGRNKLIAKRQYCFFAVPVLLLVTYYLQYRFKSTLILGFGYSLMLLVIYIYSYSTVMRSDDLTHLPDIYGFERMVAYRVGTEQPFEIMIITLQDWKKIQLQSGYEHTNYALVRIADYLKRLILGNVIARHGNHFFIILEGDNYEMSQNLETKISERFQREWTIENEKENMNVHIEHATYTENSPDIQTIMNWVMRGIIE